MTGNLQKQQMVAARVLLIFNIAEGVPII